MTVNIAPVLPIADDHEPAPLVRGLPWLGRAELLYAAALVCVLTQGPVLSLWIRRTQAGQGAIETAVEATYVLAELPAIVLLSRRLGRRSLAWRSTAWLAGFVSLMVLSTTWSLLRTWTSVAAVGLATTAAAGLYLAVTFRPQRLLLAAFVGLQPGLLASEWASRRKIAFAIDDGFNWTGIYFNRNSLGPPAAIGGGFGLALVWWLVMRRPARWPALTVLTGMVAVYDLRILRLSGSATSIVMVAAMLGSTAAWMVITSLAKRRGVSARRVGTLGAGSIGLLFAVGVAAYAMQARVSRWLHRPAGFDGRTEYWQASWKGFKAHPFLGWGWLSAWHTPAFKSYLSVHLFQEVWSHSAYFDVVLGGGIIGVVAFVGLLSTGFANGTRHALADPVDRAWLIGFMTAFVVGCTQESFLIGHHFLWLLFVAAIAMPLRSTHAGYGTTPIDSAPPSRTDPLEA